MKPTSLLLSFLLITFGCSVDEPDNTTVGNTSSAESTAAPTAETAMPMVKPEAIHVAEFRHKFPDPKEEGNGASGGITPVPVPGQPFYGFDGANHSSETEYKGNGKVIDFQMKFVDHHDGKDIYEITRTVTLRKTDGSVTNETKGAPKTVTVEYAGEELTVFDDKHGISRFFPRPTTRAQK